VTPKNPRTGRVTVASGPEKPEDPAGYSRNDTIYLGERNLIFSFTDFWGEILGRRREKNKN
jgi:hypothetical protein